MESIRKKKVFISYAREDKTSALRVKDYLEENGVGTWIDIEDVSPGTIWRGDARIAMNEADYFIALLSETSIKKEGYVRTEFDFALNKQRNFPDNRIYILPIRVDTASIPKEFSKYNWLDLSESALEKVLRCIEGGKAPIKQPAWVLILWILIVCFCSSVIVFSFNWQGRTHLIFKATIHDLKTNEPIQEAYAFLLGPNDDTIIKSAPSGSNGQVSFELDTTNEIQATVWYYHPRYEKISKSYTLMAHETYRSVKLQLKNNDTISPVVIAKTKLYSFDGWTLTDNDKQKIKAQTGYNFSYNDAAKKITVDYDHGSFTPSVIEGKFVFWGSPVYLSLNSTRINTGIFFPSDGTLPRRKEDIEKDLKYPFQQLLAANRDQIINTLIGCLK